MSTLLTAALATLTALATPAPVDAPEEDAEAAETAAPSPALQRATLDNGMQIWVEPRSGAPSVAALLVIRAGSRFETLETSGLSHYLEHMVFTGTERWDEDQIKRRIKDRGGRWNGWTGTDRTRYFAHVAAGDLPLALDWLDQVVFHATLPAEKVDKEREVVFRERQGRRGALVNWLEASGFGYDAELEMRRAMFPGTSYTLRVPGEDASLESATREEMSAYMADHYSASNATLIVVGGTEMDEVLPLAEGLFGVLPPGPRPEAPPPPPEILGEGRTAVVRGPMDTDTATARIWIRTVGLAHPDQWPLTVLAEALSVALMEEIRNQEGLVYELSFYQKPFDDAGYLAFYSKSSEADVPRILEITQARLGEAAAGAINAEQVERAKASLIGGYALAMEDNASRASTLALWSSLLGPDDPVPDSAAALRAVTEADVDRVAARYLLPERQVVGGHWPIFTLATEGRWLGLGALVAGLGLGLRRWRRRRTARA